MDALEERFAAATAAARGHATTTTTSTSAPPIAIARASPGNIRSLILEKEKELHDINDYRIRTLESLLRDKENAAQSYKQKFSKLQEDFKYNLKLLEGRDEELALYDTNFASLKSVLRDREAEISELKAHTAELQADFKQEQKRASDQELYFQQKLKDARAQMEGARWNFDDELRRTRDEMENSKRKMERQLREQQEDVETQRREITITFDDVMRQRESEFKQTVDELTTKNRELELKVKSIQRESDMSKERCEELKIKMENMQQICQESEKEAKSMEWQLADVRTSKETKIHELENEILKLQEIKQSLLDEYEGKMAELLQSLHSVEKAFVAQKAHYEDELQRHLRKKDEDTQNLSVRMDGKVQSLIAKLRTLDEANEKLQAEMKQLTWESEDKLLEKDREVDKFKQEVDDLKDQQQRVVAEMKQQLWTSERETLSLQEKLKDVTLQLQLHREKETMQRHDLSETLEKQDDLKRELVTLNLRWENKYQEQEQELTSRHELRVRELQHAKDRIVNEKQATEERLVHAENDLHRLRAELMTLKSDARVNASFGSQFMSHQQQQRQSREDAASGVPSPLWSEDNGTLSPITGMSPLLTESPVRVIADRGNGGGGAGAPSSSGGGERGTMMMESLQAENAKLKDLIRQMKDALSQQAQEISNSANGMSPPGSKDDGDLLTRLRAAEKQCVLLEAKLQETESRLGNGGNNTQPLDGTMSEQLTLCQAELIQAKRLIDAKNKRIAELESQVLMYQSQQATSTTTPSNGLSSQNVIANAEGADLKRRLSSAHHDIERLVKERTQLMELSNQLTAELRKLKETPVSSIMAANGVEFAGKKDYENLISDLTRSLDEARLNNKTLKKELRRMVKLLQASSQQGGGNEQNDGEQDSSSRSRTASMASTTAVGDTGGDQRRRPSTLSMMKALGTGTTQAAADQSRRSSVASSVSSSSKNESVGAPPSSLFDEELLSLVRNKIASPSDTSSRSVTAGKVSRRPSAMLPPSIPEEQNEEDQNEDEDEQASDRQQQQQVRTSESTTRDNGSTSLSMLFSRDRVDSIASAASSEYSAAPVTDARLRLQQAKEMLLLAGKKAERSASLAVSASGGSASVRLSDRETPSQKSAIKKLKDLQTKRAEMVSERKKVRNYSLAT